MLTEVRNPVCRKVRRVAKGFFFFNKFGNEDFDISDYSKHESERHLVAGGSQIHETIPRVFANWVQAENYAWML